MTSTPVSKIPAQSVSTNEEEDDSEVISILKEMAASENPVKTQPTYQIPSPPPQPTHYNSIYAQPPPPVQAPRPSPPPQVVQVKLPKSYIQQDLIQKAVIASIIAAIMFYPKTFDIIYSKFPMMQKVAPFDPIIRVFLLAVILYLLMWKLNI